MCAYVNWMWNTVDFFSIVSLFFSLNFLLAWKPAFKVFKKMVKADSFVVFIVICLGLYMYIHFPSVFRFLSFIPSFLLTHTILHTILCLSATCFSRHFYLFHFACLFAFTILPSCFLVFRFFFISFFNYPLAILTLLS